MQAVGAYLRTLREWLNLTQRDIAFAVDVSTKQIERWERGDSDPAFSSLVKYANEVNGDLNQMKDLLLNVVATSKDGEDKAKEWLLYLEKNKSAKKSKDMTSEQIQHIVDDLNDSRKDIVYLRKVSDAVLTQMLTIFIGDYKTMDEARSLAPMFTDDNILELIKNRDPFAKESYKKMLADIKTNYSENPM